LGKQMYCVAAAVKLLWLVVVALASESECRCVPREDGNLLNKELFETLL
jgi:hypothetical protein